MTADEARFILHASRPGGQDAGDPEFAEALVQARDNPALAGWYARQQEFDRAAAEGLRSVPVPPDLRSNILAGGRVSRSAPFLSARRIWAMAALFLLLAGIGAWFFRDAARSGQGWQDQALATLSGLVSGHEQFDARSANVADLQRWLAKRGAPLAADLPPKVRGLGSLGCKTVTWNGHPLSIICFHGPGGPGGELVHLAMISRAAVENPPPLGHPVFGRKGDWNMASWSQGDMAMMLVTKAPSSRLRGLLALLTL